MSDYTHRVKSWQHFVFIDQRQLLISGALAVIFC
jgi:hypothetical protein